MANIRVASLFKVVKHSLQFYLPEYMFPDSLRRLRDNKWTLTTRIYKLAHPRNCLIKGGPLHIYCIYRRIAPFAQLSTSIKVMKQKSQLRVLQLETKYGSQIWYIYTHLSRFWPKRLLNAFLYAMERTQNISFLEMYNELLYSDPYISLYARDIYHADLHKHLCDYEVRGVIGDTSSLVPDAIKDSSGIDSLFGEWLSLTFFSTNTSSDQFDIHLENYNNGKFFYKRYLTYEGSLLSLYTKYWDVALEFYSHEASEQERYHVGFVPSYEDILEIDEIVQQLEEEDPFE